MSPLDEGTVAAVRLREGPLAERVLVRILGALAARADLPIDRLTDAQVAAGALARHAPRHSPDRVICVRFGCSDDGLRMDFGPLQPGGAGRLEEETALPGVGPLLPRLADEVRAEAGERGDVLRLRIGSAARG